MELLISLQCWHHHSVQVLYLWKNKLTGTIPEILGQNMNLTLLDLSSNSLNGTIPADLCAGQKLQWVILKDNQLTGAIPQGLGSCQSLTKLRLSNNNLNGSIPSGLLGLPNLTMVEIQQNQVTGPIPSGIIDSPLLSYLDFSSNYLTSSLPQSIGNLPSIMTFFIANNHFDGPIPPQICDMPALNRLDLSGNNFSGNYNLNRFVLVVMMETSIALCICMWIFGLGFRATRFSFLSPHSYSAKSRCRKTSKFNCITSSICLVAHIMDIIFLFLSFWGQVVVLNMNRYVESCVFFEL